MGIIEELLKNKEDLLINFFRIMEGKEAKTKVNLDGVKFQVGKTKVEISGNIELSFVPFGKEKK